MQRSLLLLLTILVYSISTLAQATGGTSGGTGGGGGGGGTRGGTGPTTGNIPSPTTQPRDFPTSRLPAQSIFLIGRVVAEDGSELTEAASIQTSCRGSSRTLGHTDSKGYFSVELDPNSNPATRGLGDVTDTGITDQNRSERDFQGTNNWSDCQVRAILPGYTSQVVELASRITGSHRAELGNIVVHRIGQAAQGFTISATSAAAPGKAKKDFEKGLSLEKKKDWHGAEEKFQSAVNLYPKYAVAWVELARSQMNQDREADAQQSLRKAVEADSQFIPAYQEMAEIAASRKQWQELADVTEQVLRLNPVNYPRYWFLNSAANYNLKNYDAAQKSARRGLSIDPDHKFPQLEFLLGLTLSLKHDYHGAAEHLRNYLRLAPNAEDAAQAKNQLSQVEALEVKTNTAPEPE